MVRRVLASLAVAGAVAARGQGLTPTDAKEASRFQAVVRASAQAGYLQPLVVAHGEGATDSLFVLLATREGKGVLIALLEPAGSASVRPAELERDQTPAQLGIRGITFTRFLSASDVYDLVVGHDPFMLEMSRHFETHHVLRRQGTNLDLACEFPGSSTSSASKGIGSIGQTNRVTVERVPGGTPFRFFVKTVEERTEQSGNQAATSSRSETTKEYELPSSGACTSR